MKMFQNWSFAVNQRYDSTLFKWQIQLSITFHDYFWFPGFLDLVFKIKKVLDYPYDPYNW